MSILNAAKGLSVTMVSSLNIAAFNLGNALGAWLGGILINQQFSVDYLPWVAAIIVALALISAVTDYRQTTNNSSPGGEQQDSTPSVCAG